MTRSTRESSPPEATRASGRAGSPAFAAKRNSTRSAPLAPIRSSGSIADLENSRGERDLGELAGHAFAKRRGRPRAQRAERSGRIAQLAQRLRGFRLELLRHADRDPRTRPRFRARAARPPRRSRRYPPPYLRFRRSMRSRRALIGSSSAGSYSAASAARDKIGREIAGLGLERRRALAPYRVATASNFPTLDKRGRSPRRARRWRRLPPRRAPRGPRLTLPRCARRYRDTRAARCSRSNSPGSRRAASISRTVKHASS